MEEKETTEPSKRLTEAQWIVVSSLWERGEVTLKELSEQFKISEAALSQGLKRRGIKRGSKAHLAYKELEAKHKEEKEKMIEEIYHFKKKFLRYGDFLMTLTMNEITEAKKAGVPLLTRKNEIDTIISATKVYKTIRNDMYHLYDLYNPDTNTEKQEEFNIGVYSEKELEDLREAQELLSEQMLKKTEEEIEELDEPDDNYEGD
jgi:hypothetical protein